MATTRRRKPAFTIRTVRTKEDRKRPSVFMRLKTDEAFKMYALFEPDPELDDNPGYFEYYDHYDKQGNAYVPCTGESCPFCAANDNPSTRALTAWLDPSAGDKNDRIKIFTMNFSTTQDISDEAEDEGGVLGKMVRVKRLSDKGDYRVKITTDKPLTKAQTKEAMTALDEKFQSGLQGLVERQLEVQMERLKALEAMEDDDEDEEREERSTARRGRATNSSARNRADEDEEENGDEDEEEGEEQDEETTSVEEQELELLSVSKRNNSVTVEIDGEEAVLAGDEDEIDVSDFRKGDVAVVTAEWDDEDGAWVLTAIESAEGEQAEDEDEDEEEDEGEEADEDGDEEEEGEEVNSIEGGEYEVVRVEADDEILHLQNDDGKVKMWVGEGVNPDYDAIKKGVTVTLDAQTDEEGDWIVTAVKVKPARRQSTRKTTTARKTTSTGRKTTSRTSRKK